VAYAIENALFQWEDGARRLRDASEYERPTLVVLDELRRRLGSSFNVAELAALYGDDADWAWELAERSGGGSDAPWIVDAAFYRYAREASDFAGGRLHRARED
jgi:hypothetical protein